MTRRAPEAEHAAPCCGQRSAGYVLWWSIRSGGVYECNRCGAAFAQADTVKFEARERGRVRR
jgi:hypothetical protein